jgi:hypothetical protein
VVFKRKRADGAQPADDAGRRPTDTELIGMVHARLRADEPALFAAARVRDSRIVGRTWSVMALPNHSGHPNHFDIGFVPSLGNTRDVPVVTDCVQGLGTPAEAAQMAVEIWRETAGACFLELLTRHGDYADHRGADDPDGIRGWHTVASGVIAYGPDEASSRQLRTAMIGNRIMPTLTRVLVPHFQPHHVNGVKFLLSRGADQALTAEVRINGFPDEAASRALAALPWPTLAAGAVARFYAVAMRTWTEPEEYDPD